MINKKENKIRISEDIYLIGVCPNCGSEIWMDINKADACLCEKCGGKAKEVIG